MTPPNVDTGVFRTLHRIHRQLSDLNGRLDRGPKQIRAVEAYVEHQEQQLSDAQAKTKTARMAADAKQVQLKGGEGKIAELKQKLNTAGSNREYQSLLDQIAALKMTNSVLDDEILEAWEKIEQLQEKTAEAEANLAKAHQKSEKVHRNVQEEEPRIRADLTRLEAQLKECESNMPADARELYHRLIRQKGDDALAAIDRECCTGCHQHIQLNVVAEVMMGRPMICTSCGRMLYMPEDTGAAKSDDE